jgi:hypothetical protein
LAAVFERTFGFAARLSPNATVKSRGVGSIK